MGQAQKKTQTTLRQYVKQIICDFTGKKDNKQILRMALSKMTPIEIQSSTEQADLALVAQEVSFATIETYDEKGTKDLFGDSYLSRLMKTDDGKTIHVREAEWEHHQCARDRQILNMRKANSKFETEEQRRDQLRPIMEGTSISTEQAVWTLQAT